MSGRLPGEILIQTERLTKLFPVGGGFPSSAKSRLHAVDDVTLEIRRGETLGLVGESGCGKTTTAKLLLRLLTPTAGNIRFHNADGSPLDLASIRGSTSRRAFHSQVQIIFQDPFASLDPRMTVGGIVGEPLEIHGAARGRELRGRVSEMLHAVGLAPAGSFISRRPPELSGGQRQRVAIARALALHPALVVADEPTSMLDAPVCAGIMNLMLDLAAQRNIAYLFITHDLSAARYMSDRLAVMYLGKIVETGPTEEILARPFHPYTRALLSAVPVPDPRSRREPPRILGGVKAAVDPAPECRFLERCPQRAEECRSAPHPPLEEKSPGHFAACYLS